MEMPFLAYGATTEACLDFQGQFQTYFEQQNSTHDPGGFPTEPLPADEPDSDEEDGGCSDTEGLGSAQDDEKDKKWLAPSVDAMHAAHGKLDTTWHPQRKNGKGHLDPNFDLLFRSHLEGMKHLILLHHLKKAPGLHVNCVSGQALS